MASRPPDQSAGLAHEVLGDSLRTRLHGAEASPSAGDAGGLYGGWHLTYGLERTAPAAHAELRHMHPVCTCCAPASSTAVIDTSSTVHGCPGHCEDRKCATICRRPVFAWAICPAGCVRVQMRDAPSSNPALRHADHTAQWRGRSVSGDVGSTPQTCPTIIAPALRSCLRGATMPTLALVPCAPARRSVFLLVLTSLLLLPCTLHSSPPLPPLCLSHLTPHSIRPTVSDEHSSTPSTHCSVTVLALQTT